MSSAARLAAGQRDLHRPGEPNLRAVDMLVDDADDPERFKVLVVEPEQ